LNFGIAVKRPFELVKNFWIGSLLYLLSKIPAIGFFIGLLPQGYILGCAKKSLDNDHSLPDWTDWIDYLAKGIAYYVISLIYYVPFLIFLIVFFGKPLFSALASILGTVPSSDVIVNILLDVFTSQNMFFLFLIVFLFVVAAYVLPVAILNYLKNNSFGTAFNLRQVFSKSFTFIYLKAIILSLLYSVFVAIIMGMLVLLFNVFGEYASFFISLVLLSMASFVIGVTSMTLFGMAYADIEDSERIVKLSRPAVKKKSAKKKK
jgi:hypothetical protein